MRRKTSFFSTLFTSAFILLCACNCVRPNSNNVESPETPATPVQQTVKGMLVSSREGATFKDCATDREFWIKDETGMVDSLYHSNIFPPSYPREPVIAVLKGAVGPRAKDGIGASYDGVFTVKKVDSLYAYGPLTACMPYDFWCHGNEPFWSLHISEALGGIFYKNIGTESAAQFAYVKPEIKGNTWTYNSAVMLAGSRSIKIVITQQACDDGMSEIQYKYYAEAYIDGQKLRGVAERKGDRK